MSPYSTPETVAWEVSAKRLDVDGAATDGKLTVTNRRLYWTRRQSLLSKLPPKPCAEIYWPEMAAVVEHRIEKHSLFVAQRRPAADRLRFWVNGSDGERLRRHFSQLGFDTHAWT